AIVPEFGPDWDTTTLVPVTLPARQSNAGAWIWTISPTPDGPHHGFFFDRNSNGNPADNTGDQGNVMSSWTGCWRIRTKPQCTTNDLSVNINLYSDDQTGTGVPGFICSPYDVLHSECASSCCHGLYVNISQPTNCASNNASVVAAGYQVTGTDTFNYYLVNQYHDTIQSYPSITGAVTFANLSAGQYIVSAVNLSNGNCEAFQTLTIHPAMQASVMQTAMGCDSTSSGTAYAVVSGGLSPYTYNWLNVPAANQNDSVAIGLPDGWIHVQISDAAGCIVTDSVFIQSIPAADPSFSYNHVPYCSNTDTIHVTTLPASPGGVFNLVSPLTAGITVDTGNGDIFLHNTTFATPFWVYVSYSVSNGCSASYTDSVQVIAVPSPPVASTPSTISYCVGSSLPVLGINPNANYIPFWVNVQDNSTALGYSYTPPAGSITAPGQYYYTAFYYSSLSGGCASLPTLFLINAALPPVIQVSGDTTICANEVAFMNASGCSSCTYNWSPAPTGSSSTSPSASTSPSSSTTYTVTATDASGCADMQTVNVVIDQSGACGGGSSAVSGEIHPWGGITPNGDGNNDTWVIDGIDAFPDAIVIIYNRWGMEVWRKSGYDNTNVYWSGEAKDNSRLPDGTYYYIIQLDDSSLHGWVELSR
ncbi:MAG TPA: gliding motility-associated C-terminal domain-containing protein, partial [Bacteroidia bacterium]|nr:gliding motility-associated C-terminal domain-containing protein [Bacteroidia bacterium]